MAFTFCLAGSRQNNWRKCLPSVCAMADALLDGVSVEGTAVLPPRGNGSGEVGFT